jgi:protein SEY1
MGLLKTVFEVNLGLFGKRDESVSVHLPRLLSAHCSPYFLSSSQRTLLLFVIRDHIGVTPLANLQTTLTQDMHRIWDALAKPQGLTSAKLEDYFDLAFETLPHKVRSDHLSSSPFSLRILY